MEFSKRLYEVRKRSGMTQNDLAEKLNVSRQAVSRWELGTAKPEFENLVAISEIFGVSIDYLLKGEPEPSQDRPAREPEKDSEGLSAAQILWALAIGLFIILAVVFSIGNQDWNSGIFTALIVVMLLSAAVGLICLVVWIVRLVVKRMK